ncbi:MAG: putative toxin-antitoxin system toxin component, PIN family [Synergistaceae bacterium]|jgi:putative PIN family toxin of toxin-antitoxin system|nr:putative toxin-antitoxin system toxin component, PIN family [Synergistaceae bacterium]
MLVVLDTNVLFSALISPHGTSNEIYHAWRSGRFELVTSIKQLDEIRRASRYPKFRDILQPARVGTLINNMRRATVLGNLDITEETDDPGDAFLLAMASASGADYLVTGDRRAGLLERGHFGRTRITTPSVFCSEIF